MKTLYSFSYKHGKVPAADMVIDCRGMANPHSVPSLKNLTGRSELVREFVMSDRSARASLAYATNHLTGKHTNTVAFGCVGGRHRSVALAEAVASLLRAKKIPVEVKHLALEAVDSGDKSATG